MNEDRPAATAPRAAATSPLILGAAVAAKSRHATEPRRGETGGPKTASVAVGAAPFAHSSEDASFCSIASRCALTWGSV